MKSLRLLEPEIDLYQRRIERQKNTKTDRQMSMPWVRMDPSAGEAEGRA
jgi:hypothetical protein